MSFRAKRIAPDLMPTALSSASEVADEYLSSDAEKEAEFETAVDHVAHMKLRIGFDDENEYTPDEQKKLDLLNLNLFKCSLKLIKANGVDIGVDAFERENKQITSKHKRDFAAPNDPIPTLRPAEGVDLTFYKTKDETPEKFFIKTFKYKKNKKGSSAAIFAKILSEIYYQKKAAEVAPAAAAAGAGFIVPKIISHGRITALAGTTYHYPSEEEEQYYIKMEYLDMEKKYVSLSKILEVITDGLVFEDDMKKIEARAVELCTPITTQLDKINAFLIENKIYHNDLPNTDNILLNKIKYDETGTIEIVIIDFGEASSTQGSRSDYNPHQLCLRLKESGSTSTEYGSTSTEYGSTSIKGGKSKTKKQKKN